MFLTIRPTPLKIDPEASNLYRKSYCLVCILAWWCHGYILLWNRRLAGHHRQRLAMITYMDINDIWFQLDCATFHIAHDALDILQEQFKDMVIWSGGCKNWPSRWCDLIPIDFFLWGFLIWDVHEVLYFFFVLMYNWLKIWAN